MLSKGTHQKGTLILSKGTHQKGTLILSKGTHQKGTLNFLKKGTHQKHSLNRKPSKNERSSKVPVRGFRDLHGPRIQIKQSMRVLLKELMIPTPSRRTPIGIQEIEAVFLSRCTLILLKGTLILTKGTHSIGTLIFIQRNILSKGTHSIGTLIFIKTNIIKRNTHIIKRNTHIIKRNIIKKEPIIKRFVEGQIHTPTRGQ